MLTAATIVAVAGPARLAAPPSVALTAWIASIAGVFFLGGSAPTVMVWPSHAPAEGLVSRGVFGFQASPVDSEVIGASG